MVQLKGRDAQAFLGRIKEVTYPNLLVFAKYRPFKCDGNTNYWIQFLDD